jgi:hyperosmotically inducible protein
MTYPTLAAWALALLLVAGTFMVDRAYGQEPVADATLTERVQSAIAKDRRLADIEVRTHEGVVRLTGFVRTVEDIARAGELARAVRGVLGVTNGLRVANQPSRARAPAAAGRIPA